MTWHHRGSGFSSLMNLCCVTQQTWGSNLLLFNGQMTPLAVGPWRTEVEYDGESRARSPRWSLLWPCRALLRLQGQRSQTLCMCSLKWSNRGLLLHWLAGWQLPKCSCSLSASPYSCDTWEGGKGRALQQVWVTNSVSLHRLRMEIIFRLQKL